MVVYLRLIPDIHVEFCSIKRLTDDSFFRVQGQKTLFFD